MGKTRKWFCAVKKAFRSSEKTSPEGDATAQASETAERSEIEKVKPSKGRHRWRFRKASDQDSSDKIPRARDPRLLPEKDLHSPAKDEQNKRVLAVAAATAAAAEAAIAAAHAAAEVVRLAGPSRPSYCGEQTQEEWAAVKIQTAFRGYLARRALRALRGLVRLQALVRGHTVRKQSTLTMRCMQTLVRVQTRVRARRGKTSEERQALQRLIWRSRQQEFIDNQSSPDASQQDWDDSVQTIEEIEANKLSKEEAAKKRERTLAYAFAHQLWRSAPKSGFSTFSDGESQTPYWGWSWLERWMAARPWDASIFDAPESFSFQSADDSTRGKVDTAVSNGLKRLPRSRGAVRSFASPATPTEFTLQSPIRRASLHSSAGLNVRSARNRGARILDEEASAVSTARSTSSLFSVGPKLGVRNSVAVSSVRDDESLGSPPAVRAAAIPNYMTTTESTKAKFRSHSNPKQRPGALEKEPLVSTKRRLRFPANETTYPATPRSCTASVSSHTTNRKGHPKDSSSRAADTSSQIL
eukprot:c27083_g2_i1 orf=178-1755(+)